jgi:hypothetical protein
MEGVQGHYVITNYLEDDPSEFYRQRGRWFLLLGALLGGIILIATALGFWLENWGNHIGGGRGEDAHGIAVAFGVVLTVVAIVVALMIWRARVLLARAASIERVEPRVTSRAPSPINAAVAAWTSSAVESQPRVMDDPPASTTGVEPAPVPDEYPPAVTPRSVPKQSRANLATELVVGSESGDRTLADIIQIIGVAGIQADGLWSAAGPRGVQVHLVVRNTTEAEARLTSGGLRMLTSQDVVLVDFDDHPGAAAEIFRQLTEAGVRVSSAQLTGNTRMVILSEDPHRVIEVLA